MCAHQGSNTWIWWMKITKFLWDNVQDRVYLHCSSKSCRWSQKELLCHLQKHIEIWHPSYNVNSPSSCAQSINRWSRHIRSNLLLNVLFVETDLVQNPRTSFWLSMNVYDGFAGSILMYSDVSNCWEMFDFVPWYNLVLISTRLCATPNSHLILIAECNLVRTELE